MRPYILQDWKFNTGSSKRVQVALVLFRLQSYSTANFGRASVRASCARLIYGLYSQIVAGFEIPADTEIGARLRVWHGWGVVINSGAVIGNDVHIRHHVTIGRRGFEPGSPIIEDGVVVGVGATIVGAVRVGARASIGAHALVTFDVPPGSRVRAPRSSVL